MQIRPVARYQKNKAGVPKDLGHLLCFAAFAVFFGGHADEAFEDFGEVALVFEAAHVGDVDNA